MRRTIGPDAGGVGALDPAAIAEVAAESWPVARDAEELHDALLTLVVVPPVGEWEEFFRTLRESRRATVLSAGGANFWVAAERLKSARLLYPDATIAPDIDDYDRTPTSDQESAATETLRGWLESSGPQTQSGSVAAIRAARRGDGGRAAAARGGRADSARPLHGVGRGATAAEIEWCNRRVLARIHRLTLGRLRREIEPVNARDFMRFLYHWQHLKPGTQLHGPDGALHVIKQLQGYEISAAAWEGDVLRRRSRQVRARAARSAVHVGRGGVGTACRRILRSTIRSAAGTATARRVRPTRSAPLRCSCAKTRRGCSRPRQPRASRGPAERRRRSSSRDCRAPPARCSNR